ncbi:MAG TPA: head GIN domain-containing protein [Flavitalea sp.]|nr:head GIN domain-containing protein [Flavitalea sp.]
MKNIFLSLFMLVSVLVANSQAVFHDKDAELRQVGDFEGIEVSSAIDLQLVQGNENSVAVSAPGEANRAGIKTEVRKGILHIWYENKNWLRGSGRKIRAYVSAKSLRLVSASGACDVNINGELKSDELAIRLSGASDFKGTVTTKNLNIDLSGASDIVIKGSTSNLSIDASGASHFKGYGLSTDNCRVDASGATDIKITVNKVLNAEASGATNIDYMGTGMIGDLRTSGASNIRKRS